MEKNLFERLKNIGYKDEMAKKISQLLEPDPTKRTRIEDLFPLIEKDIMKKPAKTTRKKSSPISKISAQKLLNYAQIGIDDKKNKFNARKNKDNTTEKKQTLAEKERQKMAEKQTKQLSFIFPRLYIGEDAEKQKVGYSPPDTGFDSVCPHMI